MIPSIKPRTIEKKQNQNPRLRDDGQKIHRLYPPPLLQPTCLRILYVSGISPRCWIFRQIQHNLSSQSVSRDGHANQQMLLPVIDAIQELE